MTHREQRAKLLSGAVAEGFREGAVFELDLEGSIGGGSFPGREGVLGRRNSGSQGKEAQKSRACSWEEELLIVA